MTKPICEKKCAHPGCNEPRAYAGRQPNGKPFYRKKCLAHYHVELAEKRGFASITDYARGMEERLAKQQGISLTEFRRRKTIEGRNQKTYCENIDGRLGYVCTTHIILDVGMLHVDHIDGNSSNIDVENFQTLCACCHAYKTNVNKDYATPGRKTLKLMQQQNNSMSFH